LRLNAKSGIVTWLDADDWVRIRDRSQDRVVNFPAVNSWS
jgi:hypothetical protein